MSTFGVPFVRNVEEINSFATAVEYVRSIPAAAFGQLGERVYRESRGALIDAFWTCYTSEADEKARVIEGAYTIDFSGRLELYVRCAFGHIMCLLLYGKRFSLRDALLGNHTLAGTLVSNGEEIA